MVTKVKEGKIEASTERFKQLIKLLSFRKRVKIKKRILCSRNL